MPSDSELQSYAGRLPQIYRDILGAFPEIEPGRSAGSGLALQTLAAHFANTHRGHDLGMVRAACIRLVKNGILEMRNGIFAHPTDIGERLISIVANKPMAPQAEIPELPSRTW